MGRQTKQREDGRWYYPPLDTEMEEAGFEDMVDYVLKIHNIVAQYIATRPILYICKNAVRRPWEWVDRRWWKQ